MQSQARLKRKVAEDELGGEIWSYMQYLRFKLAIELGGIWDSKLQTTIPTVSNMPTRRLIADRRCQ